MTQTEKQVLEPNIHDAVASPAAGDSAINRLLSLYPNAKPVRIPVRVQLPPRGKGARENTIIAFKKHDAVIILMKFPLCCGERILVDHPVEADATSAVTVAVVPNGIGWVVAARFIEGVPRWILRS